MEGLDAEQVAERAMKIAAEICVYTNDSFVKEVGGWLIHDQSITSFFWGGEWNSHPSTRLHLDTTQVVDGSKKKEEEGAGASPLSS